MISLAEIFEQEIILENQRMKLLPLREEHWELLEDVAYDPGIWQFGLSKLENRNQLIKYISIAVIEREDHQSYPFLIFDKQKQLYAGTTRYMSISIPNRRLEIGSTWMHSQFQGSGLNKACKFELLRFGFETLQLNRIEFKTDVLNLQSRKAILKTGAKEEGIFRSHLITSTGRIRDSIFYSIIREEWPAIKSSVFSEFIRD